MAKTSPLYRLEVVPLVPLFGKRDPRFSYASTEPVINGSLVKISFGKRDITGVTLDCQPLPGPMPNWMKMVGTTILPGFLTPEQIAIAESMSDTLFTPLNIVLKQFFPMQHLPREQKKIPNEKWSSNTKVKRVVSSKKSPHGGMFYEGIASESALLDRVLSIALETIHTRKQLLLLLPEVLAAELYALKMKALQPEWNIVILSSAHTARETFLAYESIRLGEASIIIGTRQAVFAPFAQLGNIIVLDGEKRLSYAQWEMTPRYDALEIARFIAEERQIPLYKLSIAPGLSYFLTPKPIGKPFRFSSKHDLAIIDMRLGYHKRQANQALSLELIRAIRETTERHESILILVKQRGLTRFSLCAKCQTVLRCPKCQTALTEMKSGSYHCLSCSYRSPLFPSCTNCGEMQFKSYGAGTEAVARELTRETKGGVIVLDRDAQTHKADFEHLVSVLSQSSSIRLVSTYEAAESLPLESFGLIALVEPDQGLFYPDYEAEERLWRTLHRFGGKLAKGGKLFVQTFEPESRHWTSYVRTATNEIAKEFLEERRVLHYPPYYHFIQLECNATDKESSLSIAEKVEAKIQGLGLGKDIEVLPKFLPFGRKNRYHILIRYRVEQSLPHELCTLFQTLDQTVKITHNPVSLQG